MLEKTEANIRPNLKDVIFRVGSTFDFPEALEDSPVELPFEYQGTNYFLQVEWGEAQIQFEQTTKRPKVNQILLKIYQLMGGLASTHPILSISLGQESSDVNQDNYYRHNLTVHLPPKIIGKIEFRGRHQTDGWIISPDLLVRKDHENRGVASGLIEVANIIMRKYVNKSGIFIGQRVILKVTDFARSQAHKTSFTEFSGRKAKLHGFHRKSPHDCVWELLLQEE